jgi:hypothetical protein
MCFVRGDPRTADYTVRFFARVGGQVGANDNVARVRRRRGARPGQPGQGRGRTRWRGLEPGRAGLVLMAAVAISGSVWVALSLVPLVAGVFG